MITYSERSDALYVQLSEEKVAHTKVIDDFRIVDYDEHSQVVGVELLGASAGLDLHDLPERERVEAAVKVHTFPVLV